MRRGHWTFWSACCVALLGTAVSATPAHSPTEFTATYSYVSKVNRGSRSERKLYVGKDALRLDGERPSTFLLKDRATGNTVLVDPKRATREKSSWSAWPTEVAPGKSPCGDSRPTCLQLKTEVLNGRRVEKWKETNPSCLGCETSFIWVDRALGFEVRRVIVGIETHELEKIRLGPPPASVLAIPAGLRDPSEPDEAEAAACARDGGRYERRGFRGVWLCDRPMKDKDKPCSNGRECESGICVAPKGATPDTKATGTCFGRSITLSTCLARVEGGVVRHALCID